MFEAHVWRDWHTFQVSIPKELAGIPFLVPIKSPGLRLERRTFLNEGDTILLGQRYVKRAFASMTIPVVLAVFHREQGFVQLKKWEDYFVELNIECVEHPAEALWAPVAV